jgi:hypothetical protein
MLSRKTGREAMQSWRGGTARETCGADKGRDHPDNKDAHAQIRRVTKELEERGIAPTHIVDALLVIGINAGVQIVGKDKMAKFLEDGAAQIRRGFYGTTH